MQHRKLDKKKKTSINHRIMTGAACLFFIGILFAVCFFFASVYCNREFLAFDNMLSHAIFSVKYAIIQFYYLSILPNYDKNFNRIFFFLFLKHNNLCRFVLSLLSFFLSAENKSGKSKYTIFEINEKI